MVVSKNSRGRLTKSDGSFYTPPSVARAVVDMSLLASLATETSQVMDPAAGDGALLVAAIPALVGRLTACGASVGSVAEAAVANVHAIEIDGGEAARCRENLTSALYTHTGASVDPTRWDVAVGDALDLWRSYEGRMDFVLMNPPYVRIQNMSDAPAGSYVSGMSDLYYAFFEYAQKMLAPNGKLSAIAPSSWMTSNAGAAMRSDLMLRGVVEAVCDYGHLQVFAPYATAYTAVVRIGAEPSDHVELWGHGDDGRLGDRIEVCQPSCWHGGLFAPSSVDLDAILATPVDSERVYVRNGYATNLDRFFMSMKRRFSAYEIPVVKASRASAMYAVYPYDEDGRLVGIDEIRGSDPGLAGAFDAERAALLARTQVDPSRWWAYARTQGISDTYRDKVAVQTLVRSGSPPKTADAPAGTGVFGGVYVVGMGRRELSSAVSSEEFFSYVEALRKYKSGGYYSLGGRDLGRFLSWWRSRLC